MSSELAEVRETRIAARPLLTRAILDQETEQRKLLGEYVKREMVEGTDYGVIPGTKDKTLLKPGAEKLTDLFRCTPEFEFVEKITDWERPLFHYMMKCRVLSRESGALIAEGFGSCNSREGKYRWRTEDRKCPHCGAAAIMRSKFPPRDAPDEEPGWYCFAKRGGCGANFPAGDESIEGQKQGRVENDDVATLNNNILKIAKKRALVDAAIALARCSDMFTQDMEDQIQPVDHAKEDKKGENFPATSSTARPPTATTGSGNNPSTKKPPSDAALVDPIAVLFVRAKTKDDIELGKKLWEQNRAKITEMGNQHLLDEYNAACSALADSDVPL